MERIEISVVIPVYNSEKFIVKCLDSLERQSMKEIEVILINDGSTDRTEELIMQYQQEHSLYIRLFTRKNAGQAAARNFGILQAAGKYIAFMDSDDYVEEDYLQQLYQTAQNCQSEVVTCGYRSVRPDGTVLQTVSVSSFADIADYGRPGMFVVWAKLFLREFLLRNQFRFPEGGMIYEDVPFSLETKFKGKNVKAIAYIGYNYVQHSLSTMASSKVTCSRFPFDKMDEVIRSTRPADPEAKNRFEFEILHFFAGFLFFFCRKASREDIRRLSSFAVKEIRTYFPQYKKNPYLGLIKEKELPLVHRIAIWIFVQTVRLRMLNSFAFAVTRL
ncbi:MAG: glycosyltransferase [Lachnospiraceae bacterium]|nr:glycosyltransferase [Lachnospiraceae bacterium]